MADFAVASNPVWSPDGKALLIEAVKTPAQAALFDWWWAPVEGGAPVRTGVMDWPDLRADANRQNTVWSGPWTKWGFLIAEGARILMLPLSLSNGGLTGEPQPLTFGVGTYETPTISLDGQVIFSSSVQGRCRGANRACQRGNKRRSIQIQLPRGNATNTRIGTTGSALRAQCLPEATVAQQQERQEYHQRDERPHAPPLSPPPWSCPPSHY